MAVKEIIAKLAMDFDKSSLKIALDGVKQVEKKTGGLVDKVNKGADGIGASLNKVAGLVAGAFAFSAIKGFVGGMIEAGDALGDMSARTGIAVSDLQSLSFVSEALGADAETLTNGIQKLNLQLGQGAGSAASKRLAALGISARDAAGNMKAPNVLLGEIATKTEGVTDQAKLSAIAVDLFGKAGKDLVPVLKGGGKNVQGLFDKFEDLGGGLSGKFVEQAGAADDALKQLAVRGKSLQSRIGEVLLPQINKALVVFDKWVSNFQKLSKNTNLVRGSLIAFGAVAVAIGAATASAWLPFVASVLLAVAAVTLLALAADDLITFFSGGDSLIGAMLPEDTQAKIIAFKDLLVNTFKVVKDAVVAFFTPERIQLFVNALGSVGTAIGSIFQAALKVIQFLAPVLIPIFGLLVDQALMVTTVIGGIIDKLAELVGWLASKGKPITDFLGGIVGAVSKFAGGTFNSVVAGASAQVPASPAAIGGGTNNTANVQGGPVTMNISGDNPAAIASAVKAKLQTVNESERRAAYEQLVPVRRAEP